MKGTGMAAPGKQKGCLTPDGYQQTCYHSKALHPAFYGFLLFRFSRYYLYHYLTQSYRRHLPMIGDISPQRQMWRWHGAIHDTVYNLLLDGYTELTGLQVSPPTGQMVFLLIEMTKCLDDYLDTQAGQHAGSSLSFECVLAQPALQEHLATFSRYLQHFGQARPVLTYLKKQFTEQFDAHIQALHRAQSTRAFDDILAVAQVDNGGWLRAVMETVRLFNSHTFAEDLLSDYYFFGMAGKFTDDLVDLHQDRQQGSLNLLDSLLRQTPAELAAFDLAARHHRKPGFSWWQRHCPLTYTRYFTQIAHYYTQLRSPRLRRAYDLMMLLPTFGYNLDPSRAEKEER
jgi:hypothetical protein